MVNIFSFFTGKKKSKRSGSWTDGPTASTTAQFVGTSNAAQTPAQQSVKRQTSRFLSLRTRSSSKMIDSSTALHRQNSIGSLRRKASRRSSIATVLPKFGFEGDGRGNETLGEELGVSGSSLGLENLVGLPKLRDSEVEVIYAVELSVGEVKACWDLFGKALRDTGELLDMRFCHKAADRQGAIQSASCYPNTPTRTLRQSTSSSPYSCCITNPRSLHLSHQYQHTQHCRLPNLSIPTFYRTLLTTDHTHTNYAKS